MHAHCTSRFRVVVRSLAAFLSIQVTSETELRLQPTSDLQLSAKAQQVCNKTASMLFLFSSLQLSPKNNLSFSSSLWMQTLGVLEAMPSNKQYAELEDSVNKAVQFIRYPGHCLRDGPRLLALLANLLYPDLRYLHIIR